MKKIMVKLLIVMMVFSLLTTHSASSTAVADSLLDQVDQIMTDISKDKTSEISVADAKSYFGEYNDTREMELAGLGAATCYTYISVDSAAVEKYQKRMEALGFVPSITEREDRLKLIQFNMNDSWILLIYSPADSNVALCYQEDTSFIPEKAQNADQISQLMGSIGSTKLTQPQTEPPTPTDKPEVGYVDVDIDQVHYHFRQVSTHKYSMMGESLWEIRFETTDNIRDDVKSTFELILNSSVMSGDKFMPANSALEMTYAGQFSFCDKDGYWFIMDQGSNFLITIDTMDQTGYEFTGQLKGTIYGVVSNKIIRVKNGTFKFIMHEGDDEEAFY